MAARRLTDWIRRILIGCILLFSLPLVLTVIFRWVPVPTTAFMLRHWITEGKTYRYEWVSADEVSKWPGKAVVASEDQRFFDHWGLDLQAIDKALDERKRGRRSRGASTISQQVVKNLYLWPGQSWFRKGLEAVYTVWMELVLPKERILLIYLNIAEFGYGVYGVEAAAQRYFDRPAADITRSQAALMAVVLPNPKRMRLDRPGPYMRGRQQWVLGQMY